MSDNCIFLSYPGYIKKFGYTIRPAIVEFSAYYEQRSKRVVREYCLYLDGKEFKGQAPSDLTYDESFKTIFMLRPINEPKDAGFNDELSGRLFNYNDRNDWYHLFWEVKEADRLGDKLSYALIVHTLLSFSFNRKVVGEALNLMEKDRNLVLQKLEYIVWILSPSSSSSIKSFLLEQGRQSSAEFPSVLLDAAKQLGIDPHHHCVFELVDIIRHRRSLEGRPIPLTSFFRGNIKEEIVQQNNITRGIILIDEDYVQTTITIPPELSRISLAELKAHKEDYLIINRSEQGDYYLQKRNENPFLSFLDWLDGEESRFDIEAFRCFLPYLSVGDRYRAIKRFFYDLKRAKSNTEPSQIYAITSSNDYENFTLLRYIYKEWPKERDVSVEFLVNCLQTYQDTNQKSFQIVDGVLDWIIRSSIKNQRPVNTQFAKCLTHCNGGVLINKNFKGFADFYITYKIRNDIFDNGEIKGYIRRFLTLFCTQKSHFEKQPLLDELSGQQRVDPKTKEPLFRESRIYDSIWSPKPELGDRAVGLFVNLDLSSNIKEKDEFTEEMIDEGIVRESVMNYAQTRYGSTTPTLSIRNHDEIVLSFFRPERMRAKVDYSAKIGANPGVSLEDILKRVSEYLKKQFGDNLEKEYDPELLEQAKGVTLFGFKDNPAECFLTVVKTNSQRRLFCSPTNAHECNILTGKKPAVCQKDMCFKTGIVRDPNWEQYQLIHLLDILGYNVLKEEDAGCIPCDDYVQFTYQINRAVRFAKLFVCRECGHILFPQKTGDYNRYVCLYGSCGQYGKKVYLSYCHGCKTGLIDSRDTRKCPNGLYICPVCGKCCSNDFYEMMADRYRRLYRRVPSFITEKLGAGHFDLGMQYCYKCGALKDEKGCPQCDIEYSRK